MKIKPFIAFPAARLLSLCVFTQCMLPLLWSGTNDPACCANDPCCSTACSEHDPCSCSSSGGTGSGSIRFSVDFPLYSNGDKLVTGRLSFDHSEPAANMHTVQGLNFISEVGIFLASLEGNPLELEHIIARIVNERGNTIDFEAEDGVSTGFPVDPAYAGKFEIELLREDLTPSVDILPTFIDYKNLENDSRVRIEVASGKALKSINSQGQEANFSGINIIRKGGVIRQIATPMVLVDLHTIDPEFEFEIRFYHAGKYAYNENTQLYELLVGQDPLNDAYKRISIANPLYDQENLNTTEITQYWNDRVKQWKFNYFSNSDLWEAEVGELLGQSFELVRLEKSSLVDSSDGIFKTYQKEVYDAAGNLLSKDVQLKEKIEGSSDFKLVETTQDPDAANRVTTYRYYTNSEAHPGEKKLQLNYDGNWTAWDYDAEKRVTLEVQPWQDLAYDGTIRLTQLALSGKATEYSYTPVDPMDDGSLQTDTARTERVIIKGVVSAITWRAIYRDEWGLHHEITERATNPGANYGDTPNLRSEKIYYPPLERGEDPIRAGRLMLHLREDGSLLTYQYSDDGAGRFAVLETHNHAEAQSGLAYKSTATRKIYDAQANLVERQFMVYNGSTHEMVYYETHAYDAERNRTETRRFDGIPGGRVTYSATYECGQPVTETDAAGHTVHTLYDILDRKELETVEGSAAAGVGDILRHYSYATSATGCGCTAAETRTQGTSGSLSFIEINETDRVKRVSRQVDANGLETRFEYAGGGRITTETRPDGSTRITTKYLDGRLKSVTGTGVVPEYYSYGVYPDGSTWARTEIGSSGSPRYRLTVSDPVGRLLREESPAFDGSTHTVSYAYDTYGRLARQSEPGKVDTRYEYDALGQLLRSGLDLDSNGSLLPASYDRLTEMDRRYFKDLDGSWFERNTTTVYPDANSARAVTVATSLTRLSGFSGSLAREQQRFDVYGNLTLEQTEIDRATRTVTETLDRPDSEIDAVRKTINGYLMEENSSTVAAPETYTYDGLGRPESRRDPRHEAATTYDYYPQTQQLFTVTDAAGQTTAYSYYPNGSAGAGQVHYQTDPLLRKRYQAYDLHGRLLRIWGETDYPQAYTYNSYGELETLTTWRDSGIDFSGSTWPDPAGGDTTTWIYQPATGLLTRKEYADGKGTDYRYDATNRLQLRTWARDGGLDTTYHYNPGTGELETVNYGDPDTPDLVFTYDRLGRQTTVTDATGTRSFAYDPDSLRLVTETLDADFYQGLQLTRNYDTLGRSTGYSLEDASPEPVEWTASYTYDPTGRLSTVSDGTDTFTYAYTPDSDLLSGLSAPVHSVSYAYESNRDLMTVIDNQVSGSSLSRYGYSYDVLGRRENRQQSGSAFPQTHTDTFAYNPRSEVTGSTNDVLTSPEYAPAYTYDPIGNRRTSTGASSTSYTANALNQYTTVGAASPVHDDDGNLTSNGSGKSYTWNGENRLKSATDGGTTIDFTYDYQGRLVKKDDGTNTEVYVYDGWNRIATFDVQSSTFNVQCVYLWGLDLSGSMQGAGGVGGLLKEGDWYPTYDANGNVMQKLDGTGTAVMAVDYDPFGNIISGSLIGEYGFSTKPYVTELHCYYYGYRYYDPLSGRWQSRDPIGEAGHEILKPSFRNTLLLLSQLNSSRDAVRVQLEYLRVRLSDFSSLNPHEFEMLYAEFLEGLTELSRLSQMKQVIEDGLYPDNFNSEYSSYRFLHNNGIDYIDVNGEWGFVGAFVVVVGVYVAVNAVVDYTESLLSLEASIAGGNLCVTQGGSMANPAFSSQLNDVRNAVHDMATSCPNTSLSGPAGIPRRLSEAVGAAANAIMHACGN